MSSAIQCKLVCIILYCWSPTWERLWSNFTDCIAHIKIAPLCTLAKKKNTRCKKKTCALVLDPELITMRVSTTITHYTRCLWCSSCICSYARFNVYDIDYVPVPFPLIESRPECQHIHRVSLSFDITIAVSMSTYIIRWQWLCCSRMSYPAWTLVKCKEWTVFIEQCRLNLFCFVLFDNWNF